MFLTTDKEDGINIESFRSGRKLHQKVNYIKVVNVLWIFSGLFLILLFMPWTQNIRARGYVTALYPEQRPQEIQSIIAGRIEKWHVTEGDEVLKGDTIVFISEIKDSYFDPLLLDRTESQLKNKELSIESYTDKINSLQNQINALQTMQGLKIKQAENKLIQAQYKIQSDSIELIAAQRGFEIAEEQLVRIEKLYQEGIKSLSDVEARRLKAQEAKAKLISQQNKLLSSVNEQLNAKMEVVTVQNDYRDKLSKAESDRFSAMSQNFETQNDLAKLNTLYSSYSARFNMHYITAPQDGFISKTKVNGVGQSIKEGEMVVTIVPKKVDKAVEIYIEPIDLPIVHKGEHVNIFFDGWPSVVFSGWPNLSFGTFPSIVYAVDRNISDNGKYRVLLIPDNTKHPWPDAVQMGSGAIGMALLNNVPVWYELWRQFNGFPPDYYVVDDINHKKEK